MRRQEFMKEDEHELAAIAQRCAVGYLGVHDAEGYPRVVPLNFVLKNRCIYFHGAQEGEKFDVLRNHPKATFSIVELYSMIPSYWLAKNYACPATVFFKSIYFRGTACLVHGLTEKAMALQALMEKHQPEGKYRPIAADDQMYLKPLQEVSVFKIIPIRIDAKFKFGQNYNEKTRQQLIENLEERNLGMDGLTAAEIRRTLQQSITA